MKILDRQNFERFKWFVVNVTNARATFMKLMTFILASPSMKILPVRLE